MEMFISEVNLLTASEKLLKLLKTEPIFSEISAIDNSTVDIKLFTII